MVMALRVSAGEGEGGLPLCGVRLGVLAAAISLAQETCPIRAFVAMQVTPTVIFVPIHPFTLHLEPPASSQDFAAPAFAHASRLSWGRPACLGSLP